MYRTRNLLGDEIYCPHCGSKDLFLGEVYWETFFDGNISTSCSCRECNKKFDLWFASSCITWNDEEENNG